MLMQSGPVIIAAPPYPPSPSHVRLVPHSLIISLPLTYRTFSFANYFTLDFHSPANWIILLKLRQELLLVPLFQNILEMQLSEIGQEIPWV